MVRTEHGGSAGERRICDMAHARDHSYSCSQPEIAVSAIRVADSSLAIVDHAAGLAARWLR
jgi:hypothetical protein